MAFAAKSDYKLYFTPPLLSILTVFIAVIQRSGTDCTESGHQHMHTVFFPERIATFARTWAGSFVGTSGSDAPLHGRRWRDPCLRKSRSKDKHCDLLPSCWSFRPTECCMESWCTSPFDPSLIASDSSVIDQIVCVDRLQRLACGQTFKLYGNTLWFLHSHVSCIDFYSWSLFEEISDPMPDCEVLRVLFSSFASRNVCMTTNARECLILQVWCTSDILFVKPTIPIGQAWRFM